MEDRCADLKFGSGSYWYRKVVHRPHAPFPVGVHGLGREKIVELLEWVAEVDWEEEEVAQELYEIQEGAEGQLSN